MADVLIYGGVGLIILCVIGLIVIAFTKGIQTAREVVFIPFTLIFLIADKRGRWAWAGIALGVILLLIGLGL
jgi:hypothetical protein